MQYATKWHDRFWFCNINTQYWDRHGHVDLVASYSLESFIARSGNLWQAAVH